MKDKRFKLPILGAFFLFWWLFTPWWVALLFIALISVLSEIAIALLHRHANNRPVFVQVAELPNAELLNAIDDLWMTIPRSEMELLDPRTIEIAKANHQIVWHNKERR